MRSLARRGYDLLRLLGKVVVIATLGPASLVWKPLRPRVKDAMDAAVGLVAEVKTK